jgi:hypothetical protein
MDLCFSPPLPPEHERVVIPASERPNHIIRLFVSSTFADYRAERDVLTLRVFPLIADLCRRYEIQFQTVGEGGG